MFSSLDFKQFGKSIKEIRKNAKFTQKYVAELSGINIDTIRRIENGFVIPKYETLELLSNIYKIDLTKLLIKSRNSNTLNKLYIEVDRLLVSSNHCKSLLLSEFYQLINEIELENVIDKKEVELLKVFIYAFKFIQSDKSYDFDKLMQKLITSLKFINPNFKFERFTDYHYSELELRILLLIGLIYQDKGESAKSIPVFNFCLNYIILTTGDDFCSVKMKIKIYYNLSYAHYKIEADMCSLKAACLGIKLCQEHKLYYFLEMLFVRKAVAEFYLNDENYINSYRDSLYLLYSLGEYQQIEYLISKTKEKHGIDLSIITSTFY